VIDLEADAGGHEGRHAHVVETGFVVVISLAMIALPVAEMVLRKLRGSGVPGGSVYVQHLTLWLGFIGALLATVAGKHLGLATTNFFKPGRARSAALIYGSMVSSATCLFFAYASYKLIQATSVGGDKLAGGIPMWWSESIVPVAMLLNTLRFIWRTPGGWLGRLASLAACVVTAAAFYYGRDHASAFLWPGMILILSAFALGAPVFAALAGAAMLLFFSDGTPIASVPTETLRLVENPTLPAIPLLTLAGYVLASGGASERMVRAYKSLFGWMPGGLGLMVIMVCALFTTFTGGSGVTILALGGILYPALLKDKYPEGFSLGLVTASGSLGLLFPPSLPVILYSVVAQVSADKLFLGGLVPGVILILVVAAYAIREGIAAKAPRQPFHVGEVTAALWAAKWDLGLPVIVLVVFVGGFATIVEAAGLGAAYALVVELAVFRDVHPTKEMPRVLVQSATLVGSVVILLGVALGFSSYLVDAQVPDTLVAWMLAHLHSQWTFLLVLNAILLVLGSVFEIYAAIFVLAPLVAKLGEAYHVEPVHLGVVFLANLELGFLFPPMGLNLFLSASRFNKPLPFLYKRALPFLVIMAFGVLFITYVPAVTTGVVRLFGR
jgi:tripartite ATP-independent transporter DctM subunit